MSAKSYRNLKIARFLG